jgi:hypothetical protein
VLSILSEESLVADSTIISAPVARIFSPHSLLFNRILGCLKDWSE